MLAVDDGIFNGNITLADVLFLIAVIIFVIAAVAHAPRTSPAWPWSGVLVPLGLALVAAGWLVL